MRNDERLRSEVALRVAAQYAARLAPQGPRATRAAKTRDVLDDLVRATGGVLRWLRQNPDRATPELTEELGILLRSVAEVRELSGVRGGSGELWSLYVPSTESGDE